MKKIYSASLHWLQTKIINIEIDTNKSLPWIHIVWLPDSSIQEAKERIKSACKNIWYSLPPKKIVLNLAPSNIKKSWTRFDLAMAMGILLLDPDHRLPQKILASTLFFWELWLDWSVKWVPWMLPTVLSAKKMGRKRFVIPKENYKELSLVKDIELLPVETFNELYVHSQSDRKLKFIKTQSYRWSKRKIDSKNAEKIKDFVLWHAFAKRVLTVATIWLHNVLLIWPPGTWKTLLAKWMSSLLPPLSYQWVLEVGSVYSAAWKIHDRKNTLSDTPLSDTRPFITAHSSISYWWIFWWWHKLTPWLISLAHRWVLFLDELPEFSSKIREWLRQPMQDKSITISRYGWTVEYPCNCMVIATMNPCKCWYYNDDEKMCICSENSVKKYQSRISWPLLDRFDIIIDVTRQNIDNYVWVAHWYIDNSIVQKAWKYKNASRSHNNRHDLTHLSTDCKKTVKSIVKKYKFSTRVVYTLLAVARSIAILSNQQELTSEHILEALRYRSVHFLV